MSMESIASPLIAGIMGKVFGGSDVPSAPTAEQSMTPLQKAVYPQLQDAITKNLNATNYAKQQMSLKNKKINPKAQVFDSQTTAPATTTQTQSSTSPSAIAGNIINSSSLAQKYTQNPNSLTPQERMQLAQEIQKGNVRM